MEELLLDVQLRSGELVAPQGHLSVGCAGVRVTSKKEQVPIKVIRYLERKKQYWVLDDGELYAISNFLMCIEFK